MFAGIVNRLGFYLGPKEQILQPNKDNPNGFFENHEITDLNRLIYHQAGIAEYEPGKRIVEESVIDPYPLVVGNFGKRNKVALKDPRMILTLPVWMKVLEREYDVRVLSVLRDFGNHVNSIRHGGKKSQHAAEEYVRQRKKFQHMLASRYDARDVQYEKFIADPEFQIKELCKFLGTKVGEAKMKQIKKFIQPRG